jgi:transcriptional regulator with XRE-family HTH domain
MVHADKIRLARAEAGLSQRELAKRVGVHPVTVCRWETASNQVNLSLGRVHRIAEATKVTREFLLGTTEDPRGQSHGELEAGQQERRAGDMVPIAQAMPRGLGEATFGMGVRVSPEEYRLLERLFAPERGPRAERYFSLSPGEWVDILFRLRTRSAAPLPAASASAPGAEPRLRWVEDDLEEVLTGS